MLAPLLTNLAVAAAGWELHAQLGTGEDPAPFRRELGVGGGPVVWRNPRLSAEFLGQLSFGPYDSAVFDMRPELRLSLSPGGQYAPALSAFAGYGARLGAEPTPAGAAGLSLELPLADRLALRTQAGLIIEGVSLETFSLQIGVVRTPAVLAPPPPPEQAPPPPEPVTRVWLPHPFCRWVTLAELEALRPQLPPYMPIRVETEGERPQELFANAQVPPAESAPTQGGLVVAGRPGDKLTVSGHALTTGPDGVVVMTANAGVVDVAVVGGGQTQNLRAAVAANHVVWVRPPAPRPFIVWFEQGSSILDAEDRERLTQLAEGAGAWRFEVQGSYSIEGTPEKNRLLADERAAATAVYLRSVGVPADRVVVLPASIPDEGEAPELLRSCTVRPIPLETRP